MGHARNLPRAAARQGPIAALLLAGGTILLQLSPALAARLDYDRAAVVGGQWWRILTGHWVHWSGDQLFWNVACFAALGIAVEGLGRGRFLACVAASAVAISAALLWLRPELLVYRGLSGISSALVAMLAVALLREKLESREWRWLAAVAVLSLGFLAKTSFELVTGATLFVDSAAVGAPPVPLAHIAGGALGMVFGFASPQTRRQSPRLVNRDGTTWAAQLSARSVKPLRGSEVRHGRTPLDVSFGNFCLRLLSRSPRRPLASE